MALGTGLYRLLGSLDQGDGLGRSGWVLDPLMVFNFGGLDALASAPDAPAGSAGTRTVKGSDEVRENRASPFDGPANRMRWLAFGLFSLCFEFDDGHCFRRVEESAVARSGAPSTGADRGLNSRRGMFGRVDADRRGDSLVPWFEGIPDWFGLCVGAIAAVCMLAGACWYFDIWRQSLRSSCKQMSSAGASWLWFSCCLVFAWARANGSEVASWKGLGRL